MTTDAPLPGSRPSDPTAQTVPGYASRVRGCLLGGALGDQLGAAVASDSFDVISGRFGADGLRDFSQLPEPGHFTDDTQLTLYTLDGLTEALEWANAGTAADEAACLWLAYLRWYATQEGRFPDNAPAPQPRWIDSQSVLHARRAPPRPACPGWPPARWVPGPVPSTRTLWTAAR